MSKIIAEVVSKAMRPVETIPGQRISVDPSTGLKILSLGRTVTREEVRRTMDDE